MSLVDEQWAFCKDVAALILQAEELGYVFTFGEAYRTKEQEQWYVEHGLSETMHSNHLVRLAVDFNCFKDGQLVQMPEELGRYWEQLHGYNRWGGAFVDLHDTDHFERNVPGAV